MGHRPERRLLFVLRLPTRKLHCDQRHVEQGHGVREAIEVLRVAALVVLGRLLARHVTDYPRGRNYLRTGLLLVLLAGDSGSVLEGGLIRATGRVSITVRVSTTFLVCNVRSRRVNYGHPLSDLRDLVGGNATGELYHDVVPGFGCVVKRRTLPYVRAGLCLCEVEIVARPARVCCL